MNKRPLILLVGLLFGITLTSCDPAIAVVIQNKSKSDKHVKVFYPKQFTFPRDHEYASGLRDSLQTYDLSVENNYLNPTVIPKINCDTVSRTYSFFLKRNHSAKIESRIGVYPTWGQMFVIDNVDTVKLDPKSKDFQKRPKIMFGGTWAHTIADK